MKIAFFATLTGGVLLLHSVPAAANGRFPQSNQLVFSPSDENRIVLRTTYGILPSHDNGKTWGFICEDALGINTVAALADPPIALTEDSSLVVGTPVGIDVSSGAGLSAITDVGCDWKCPGGMPLANQTIADTAVRPDSPSSAVAITSTYVPTDSAQALFSNQVFETTDNGVTWTPIGVPIDAKVTVTTIDVTKTDDNRLYVSGTRGYGSFQTAVLFVSIDKGQHWIEGDLTAAQFDPSVEDSIWIGGVDPTNAGTLYIRSRGQPTGGLSRLTKVAVAADGTPTFTTIRVFDVEAGMGMLVGEMLGFAISPDGSKVYIGSEEEGLFVAQSSDMVFHQNNTLIVQCLATRQTSHGPELWACSAAKDGFIAGVSTDDGKTFTPKLPLVGALTGPIACAPNPAGVACGQTQNSSQCEAIWQTFCQNQPCGIPDAAPPDDDSGTTTTPTGDASTTTGKSSSSCSCDLAATHGGGAAGIAAALALAGVALKRRRT